MAWTINVAFLLLMLRLSSAANDFKIPLGHIHDHTQMIEHLLRVPTKFYVAGGTFEKDPLMIYPRYPFKCGEVKTEQSIHNRKVSIERRFLQEDSNNRDNAQKRWRWLSENYELEAKNSSGYNYANYVEVSTKSSQHAYRGSMYLLLSDFLRCALFYNEGSKDCELWVTEKPVQGKAINVSFCGAFITTCNGEPAQWYYVHEECYKDWP